MELKLLRAFVSVAEHGTVSKAADVLHITQPALSRQIRSMEARSGFKLFERAGRGLKLTPRGEQLVADSRSLLACVDAFGERTQALRQGDIQVLRAAAAALTIEALFPGFLRRYREQVTDVRLSLIDAEAADHPDMLEHGEADVSVNVLNTLPLDQTRFDSHALPRFQMLAACRETFDLGPSDSIAIGGLGNHPLLLLDRSYATRNVFDAACHLADFRPNIFFESRSVNTLLAMAEAGHGVAIVPSVLKTIPAGLRTKVVTHRKEPLYLNLAVIWDRRRAPSRHVEQFTRLLEAYIREAYGPGAEKSEGPQPRGTPGRRNARRPQPKRRLRESARKAAVG